MSSESLKSAGSVRPTLDAAGYRAMFELQFSYVCRTLRRLGIREADIEDAAQDTFVAVHGKWLEYDTNAPIRPWLFGFAFRVASNYRRARARGSDSAELDPDARATGDSPEEAAAGSEAMRIALEALRAMTSDRRDVFVMHDLEGFSAPAVADLLGIPMNTVYSRLRVARADFEAAIARLTKRSVR